MRRWLPLVIFSLVLNPVLDARQPFQASSQKNPTTQQTPATIHQDQPPQPPPEPAPVAQPQQTPAAVPSQQEPTTQYQQNPDEEQPVPLGQPPPIDQVDHFIQPYLQMGD